MTYGTRSIAFTGSLLWNQLPKTIKDSTSVIGFKNHACQSRHILSKSFWSVPSGFARLPVYLGPFLAMWKRPCVVGGQTIATCYLIYFTLSSLKHNSNETTLEAFNQCTF